MGHQLGQGSIEPSEMADHPEDKMLAASPVRAAECRWQRIEQRIDPLATFKPAGDQASGGRPRGES